MRYGQGIAIALIAAALAAPARGATPDEAQLRRAFGAFIQGGELRLDVVPDLYPGGYARISVYARGADLGGMLVDEAWFRLTGASLDPEALRGGTLRVLEVRDSAMYVRVSLRSLEAYFQRSDGVQDVRLSSDGQYLYGRGAVLLGGTPARVAFKGFFAVGGTKEIYFYIEDLRLNGLPVLTPLLRRWEQDINPIFSQALWPVTFKLRALRMTREGFVVSSQADPAAPCLFCTGGDAPAVAP